jgi:ADP-ribosylglycohydrolase
MLNNPPPRKSRDLKNNVERYCTAGLATDDTTQALCMLSY